MKMEMVNCFSSQVLPMTDTRSNFGLSSFIHFKQPFFFPITLGAPFEAQNVIFYFDNTLLFMIMSATDDGSYSTVNQTKSYLSSLMMHPEANGDKDDGVFK
ncbi:UNVERIFIED_CONTAM: hypothetical protein NCL1_09320 [Trichonephila clavipes]